MAKGYWVCTGTIHTPLGMVSYISAFNSWLEAAQAAGVSIPTGCLGGSCGACEIEVNGELVRACISSVPKSNDLLQVELASDPYW